MNYELIVKCPAVNKKVVYLIDWVDEYNEDAIEYGTKPLWAGELIDLEELTYDQVKDLNGKHIIFGTLECFEQSREVPYWYNRDNVTYSFKHC